MIGKRSCYGIIKYITYQQKVTRQFEKSQQISKNIFLKSKSVILKLNQLELAISQYIFNSLGHS